jgi:hypothetical protein
MKYSEKNHDVFLKNFKENLKNTHSDIFDKIQILKILNDYVLIKTKYGLCKVKRNRLNDGYLPKIQSALDKTKYFKNELKDKQPELFNNIEIISDYIATNSFIIIKNKYGKCKVLPGNLLQGYFPTILSAINKTEYFINQAIEVHGDKYDYSLVNYKNSRTKVKIISSEGIFEQTPANHLQGQGCPVLGNISSSNKQISNNEEFIKKAIEIHGDKYDYSLVEYKNAHSKVKIISSEGVFEQTVNSHLNGNGCPKLAFKQISLRLQENPTGWTHTKWEKAARKSKNFDSFKIYIIKCWDESTGETFYKIGKTFTNLKRRFDYKKLLPYNYEVVKIFIGSAKEISELEVNLHRLHKDFKYLPKKSFGGQYECFSQIKLKQ